MIEILIVEDEKPISDLIRLNLMKAGYTCTCAFDGMEAADILEERNFDLIILDVMLPKLNGFELMEYIKPLGIPVIFLTAKATLDDRLRGLTSGAEDYMVKPFGVLELSARIRSLLRRAKREEKKDTLTFEDIVVNKKTREVTSEGHLCELTLKEFELLVYLMENQSRVVTRDELLNQVWGYEYDGETRTLDMHIKTLRQKLHDAGAQIKTVRGVGYRFLREKEAGK